MSIGENIKRIREDKAMSQDSLAKEVGVTQSYIAKIENGLKIPSMAAGKTIAKVLGCTMDELAKEN
jgi:transcriptional regulator with XRE-family HTH domain